MIEATCAGLSLPDFLEVDSVDRELDLADNGPRVIGSHRFASASEAKATAKCAMIELNATGAAWAHDFLHDVAKLHPGYEKWVVCTAPVEMEVPTGKRLMLKQYERQRPGEHYRRAIVAKPVNLSTCLNEGTKRSRVVAAARHLVMPSIDVRHRMWCAICDKVIEPGDLHWDHYPTFFIDLFDDWRRENRLLCSDIKLCPQTSSMFESRALCLDWKSYHDSRAILRPAHSACNLRNKAVRS